MYRVDYRQSDYNFDLIPNQWLRERERSHEHIPVGLSPGYPAWGMLYYAVLTSKHDLVLEIGTNHGASTIIMAQAILDSGEPGRIITIEKSDVLANVAYENFKRAGVSELILQATNSSADELKRMAGVFDVDIAFIDGSHDYQGVIDDFLGIIKLLTPKGLIIFDNITMGGVHDALDWIRVAYGGNLVDFPRCSWSPPGVAFWKR
jgi:predicted O-methyltransferase YrrM